MGKKYKLLFTREFLRRLKKLDRHVQIRILREIKNLEENPFSGKTVERTPQRTYITPNRRLQNNLSSIKRSNSNLNGWPPQNNLWKIKCVEKGCSYTYPFEAASRPSELPT